VTTISDFCNTHPTFPTCDPCPPGQEYSEEKQRCICRDKALVISPVTGECIPLANLAQAEAQAARIDDCILRGGQWDKPTDECKGASTPDKSQMMAIGLGVAAVAVVYLAMKAQPGGLRW